MSASGAIRSTSTDRGNIRSGSESLNDGREGCRLVRDDLGHCHLRFPNETTTTSPARSRGPWPGRHPATADGPGTLRGGPTLFGTFTPAGDVYLSEAVLAAGLVAAAEYDDPTAYGGDLRFVAFFHDHRRIRGFMVLRAGIKRAQ